MVRVLSTSASQITILDRMMGQMLEVNVSDKYARRMLAESQMVQADNCITGQGDGPFLLDIHGYRAQLFLRMASRS